MKYLYYIKIIPELLRFVQSADQPALLLAGWSAPQYRLLMHQKPPSRPQARQRCVSISGSGAKAPAGAGQSPPGVQRAEPFGARRIGAGVQRAEPFGARRIGAGVQRAEPFGARRIGAGTYGVPSAMRRNSSSVSTGMPRSAAFCSFEPAASPATT